MDEKTSTVVQVCTEHEDEVEALRLLLELLQSADGKPVPVRIACADGTIKEIEVGASEDERQEVLAMVRRRLRCILH